ncbi:phage tail tape measure protein [Rhodococcus zopfii]
MAADVSRFPQDLEKGLKGAVGAATKIGALLGGAIGVSMGAKAILDLGNSFTNELNTMQAVSSATVEQMNAVKAAAQGLGNDAKLADTSAVDAAAAMTELAKGGFSVEQSMAAARGTLQLAAAAQIDAASAATIQSQALQAFGLDADYAAKAADVLANGANASSAEITDVAQGLQQAGAVANQFGVSLEDTVAGLGLLANAGIQGSDAGTLLKSALLALTDQGKPAQAAIADLGLTVYDAQGQFVGFRELFGQLEDASKSMTPEMYQAATATLFGSDAMRLAGVAAEQGVAGWDNMRGAIERQGAAAEVAAAKTQGLPGAISAVQNSVEGLMLTAYDAVDGPLAALASWAATGLGDAGSKLESSLSGIGSAISSFAASDMGQDKLGELTTLVDTVRTAASAAAPAIIQIGTSVATVAGMVAGGGLSVLLDVFNGAASIAGDVLVPALELVGATLEGNEAAVATLAGGFIAFEGISSAVEAVAGPFDQIREKADQAREFVGHFASATSSTAQVAGMGTIQMGRFGTAIQQIGNRVPAIANMQQAFLNAATGAERFGRTAGIAAAAGNGIKTAASGVVSALGGPLGVALAGAGIAMAAYGQHQATVAERHRQIADSAKELGTELAASNGAMTEAARAAAAAALENNNLAGTERSLLEYLDSIGVSGKQAAAGLAGSRDAMEATLAVMEEQAELEKQINSERVTGEGFGGTALGQLLNFGGSRDAANEAQNAAAAYRELYDATVEQIEAERRRREAAGELDASGTTTKLGTMADTMREFADSTGSAADKIDILNGGLATLRGDQLSMEDAQQRVNDALRGFASAVANGGAAAVNSSGQIDTSTEAGSRLYDAMKNVQTAFDEAGAAAYQSALQQGQSHEDAAAAAEAASQRVRDEFIQQQVAAGMTLEKATALADQYQLFPTELRTNIILNGYDEAKRKLLELVDPATKKIYVEYWDAQQRFWDSGQAGPVAWPSGPPAMPGRASGGRLPTTGPGTDRTDGFLAVTESGTPIARVNAGEWVINDRNSEKYDRELAMINAGTFPKLPGFETGGRIAVNRAVSVLQPEDGKPYQYAGVGTPSWDCSAYVSAGYAALTGRDPYTRWFTTESNFNALGFESGLGPRSALNIGVMRGGGGEYSHMAGTIDGIPFESSSAGVFFGRNTQGANDPSLPLKWHLPASAFVPPGDGVSDGGYGYDYGSRSSSKRRETWDEADELDLESARISVRQAQEALDKSNADPNESQADKDQAANRVKQAQLKVTELEEKKRNAELGGAPTPDAPGLGTSYTEDELRLRDLERAVQEAKWDRNDVYADPEASKFDRDEADDKLQRALNALADEQREQRLAFAPEAPALTGRMPDEQIRKAELEDAIEQAKLDRNAVYADPRSTQRERDAADRELQKALNARDEDASQGSSLSGSSIAELIGNVAKAAVQGQVESAFSVIGLSSGGQGVIGAAINLGVEAATKKQKELQISAPTFSQEELAKQGPVVPGSDGWLEELVKTLKVPAVLRDVGGPLPHGMAGLNLSGETEWVQTAADRRRFDRDMDELAALRAGRGGGGGVAQLDRVTSQLQQLIDNPPIQYKSEFNGYDLEESFRRDRYERKRAGDTYISR